MKEKKKHQETKARWNAKRTKTELAAAADAARGSATNAPYHSKQTKTKSKQTQTKSKQTQTKSKQTQTKSKQTQTKSKQTPTKSKQMKTNRNTN